MDITEATLYEHISKNAHACPSTFTRNMLTTIETVIPRPPHLYTAIDRQLFSVLVECSFLGIGHTYGLSAPFPRCQHVHSCPLSNHAYHATHQPNRLKSSQMRMW